MIGRSVLIALAVSIAPSSAVAQKVVTAPPAAHSFKVGALKLVVLRDSAIEIPNDNSVFGLNAPVGAVAKVLQRAGAPTDHVTLSVDDLLIQMPGHLVLIDTGFGPTQHGALPQSLASAGFSPAQITDILITHAHPDHIGGLVDSHGHSAFPKAVIRMSDREWASMQTNKDAAAVISAIRPQVRTFQPGTAILPGITPIAFYGHTPGHVGYRITSRGQTLLDIGDLAHSSIVSLAKPEWTMEFDDDKAEGVEQREGELSKLAKSHEQIFAGHFPYPGIGQIEKTRSGFRFRPDPS
jgi:glyoxylase-like metal-dependent hydrolase (beta-lactamase superfamily II)